MAALLAGVALLFASSCSSGMRSGRSLAFRGLPTSTGLAFKSPTFGPGTFVAFGSAFVTNHAPVPLYLLAIEPETAGHAAAGPSTVVLMDKAANTDDAYHFGSSCTVHFPLAAWNALPVAQHRLLPGQEVEVALALPGDRPVLLTALAFRYHLEGTKQTLLQRIPFHASIEHTDKHLAC